MNAIESIKVYSTKAWDSAYRREALSQIFDIKNEGLIKFDEKNPKTVLIGKPTYGRLGPYRKVNESPYDPANLPSYSDNHGTGFHKSSTSLTWESFTLSNDRSAQFTVDRATDDESAGMAMGTLTSESNTHIVIPEVDAYTFSRVADATSTALGNRIVENIDASPDTILAKIDDGLEFLENHEVPAGDQVILVRPHVMNLLRKTKEVTRVLRPQDFSEDINFEIWTYNGREIIIVPENRFFTNLTLLEDGYAPGEDSLPINFMIATKNSVYHIVRYNLVSIFGPEQNWMFDGYVLNIRLYYDVFVPEQKRVSIYVNLQQGGIVKNLGYVATESVVGKSTGTTKFTKTVVTPGDLYVAAWSLETTKSTIGTKVVLTTKTLITLDTDFTPASGVTAGYLTGYDSYGQVIAVSDEITLNIKA